MGAVPNRRPAARFEDLVVWQRAQGLASSIYQLSATVTKSEACGRITLTRRAAISVAANIAKGFPRKSIVEKVRFSNIAPILLQKLRCWLILEKDLHFGEVINLWVDGAAAGRLLAAVREAWKEEWIPIPHSPFFLPTPGALPHVSN